MTRQNSPLVNIYPIHSLHPLQVGTLFRIYHSPFSFLYTPTLCEPFFHVMIHLYMAGILPIRRKIQNKQSCQDSVVKLKKKFMK